MQRALYGSVMALDKRYREGKFVQVLADIKNNNVDALKTVGAAKSMCFAVAVKCNGTTSINCNVYFYYIYYNQKNITVRFTYIIIFPDSLVCVNHNIKLNLYTF